MEAIQVVPEICIQIVPGLTECGPRVSDVRCESAADELRANSQQQQSNKAATQYSTVRLFSFAASFFQFERQHSAVVHVVEGERVALLQEGACERLLELLSVVWQRVAVRADRRFERVHCVRQTAANAQLLTAQMIGRGGVHGQTQSDGQLDRVGTTATRPRPPTTWREHWQGRGRGRGRGRELRQ